jgi:hypothetical protein
MINEHLAPGKLQVGDFALRQAGAQKLRAGSASRPSLGLVA